MASEPHLRAQKVSVQEIQWIDALLEGCMKPDWRKIETLIAEFLKGEGVSVENHDGSIRAFFIDDHGDFELFSITRLSQEIASELEQSK
jgi:hypothetical protein